MTTLAQYLSAFGLERFEMVGAPLCALAHHTFEIRAFARVAAAVRLPSPEQRLETLTVATAKICAGKRRSQPKTR